MESLIWILGGGLLMSAVAMVGGLTVLLRRVTLERLLLPLVALAAGTLMGGAFFHMIPEGSRDLPALPAAAWTVAGFASFLALEQFLHWHHGHRSTPAGREPYTILILVGDAIHNFIGGLAISSTFLLNPKAGVLAWVAAVAHEIPQELGDFGVLVHGGWPRARALAWNFLSALTFPLGGVLAWLAARHVDVAGLVLFGAGNFLYIAASDLIPEIKTEAGAAAGALLFLCFAGGLALTLAVALLPGG